MVIGSSLVGSSGVPGSFISCTSALPLEVTRNVTYMGLPSKAAFAAGRSVVTEPFQEPARVFSLSNDFCASDWAGLEDFCGSDWAKTPIARNNKKADTVMRSDFIFSFSLIPYFFQPASYLLVYSVANLLKNHSISCTVTVNY